MDGKVTTDSVLTYLSSRPLEEALRWFRQNDMTTQNYNRGLRPPNLTYTLTKTHLVMPNGAHLTPEQMTRSQLLDYCKWNDRNGTWTDEDHTREWGRPATDEELRDNARMWMRDAHGPSQDPKTDESAASSSNDAEDEAPSP